MNDISLPMRPPIRPWRVLASRIAYADPFVSVRSDSVETGAGTVLNSDHVVEYPDWTTVVALGAEDQRLLLVQEYRHGVGAILTGLPGGLVDAADGPRGAGAAATAARRELREETGHDAAALRLLVTTFPNPSNQSNTAYVFLATGVKLAADATQEAGVELVWADFVAVLQALRAGELLLHAIHVAALWSAAAAIAACQDDPNLGALPARVRAAMGG